MPIGSDSKKFKILLATTSPILSMPISSSKLALRKTSKLLKCLAKAAAVDHKEQPSEFFETRLRSSQLNA